jgi:hypothetical protein
MWLFPFVGTQSEKIQYENELYEKIIINDAKNLFTPIIVVGQANWPNNRKL